MTTDRGRIPRLLVLSGPRRSGTGEGRNAMTTDTKCEICGIPGPDAGPAYTNTPNGWRSVPGRLDPVIGWRDAYILCPKHAALAQARGA